MVLRPDIYSGRLGGYELLYDKGARVVSLVQPKFHQYFLHQTDKLIA